METPTVSLKKVANETYCFSSYFPVIGYGLLPVNSFLIKSESSMLIDTGMAMVKSDFMEQLKSLIKPEDIKWVYLTHLDPDHIGNYLEVLKWCPKAQVITTFVGLGKMALMQLPVNRTRLLNPGEHILIGDHDLEVVRPPTFDAPESTSLFDHSTRAMFSTDSFGALLKSPFENAESISPEELRVSMGAWVTIDTPWIHKTEAESILNSLKEIKSRSPMHILSSHLPPASGEMLDMFIEQILSARKLNPFTGPGQKDFEKLM